MIAKQNNENDNDPWSVVVRRFFGLINRTGHNNNSCEAYSLLYQTVVPVTWYKRNLYQKTASNDLQIIS